MFMRFFTELKAAKIPVTLKEYLMLMDGMDKAVIDRRVEDFYYLSRTALVKDEKFLDRFDVVFGHVFKGLELISAEKAQDIPAEWLKRLTESFLTEEDKKQIEAMGGFDKFMEMLQEQMKRAQEARATATRRATRTPAATAATSPSGPTVTTPKASASARTRAATAGRSRYGTSASTRISTIRSSSAPATSRSPCAGCASSLARARPTNWT
jgi:uncharacterized protein with von Willebrand factor type A (vWA) domain